MKAYWDNIVGDPLRLFVAVIIVAGASSRLFGLTTNGFWIDEISTVVRFSDPSWTLLELLEKIVRFDHTPPFYYMVIWAWRHLVEVTEVSMRVPSVIFSLIAIACALFIRIRGLSDQQRLVFAALMAVSHGVLLYAQEARAYSLLILISLLITQLTLVVALRMTTDTVRSFWPIIWLTLLSAIGAYTHFFGLLIGGAAFSTLIICSLVHGRRLMTIKLIVMGIVSLLLFMPWLVAVAMLKLQPDPGFMENSVYFYLRVVKHFGLFVSGNYVTMALIGIPLLIVSFRFARRVFELRSLEEVRMMISQPLAILLMFCLCLLVPAALISIVLAPIINWRNLLVLLPALYFAMAVVLTRPEEAISSFRGRSKMATVVLLSTMFFLTLPFNLGRHKSEWRESAQFIASHEACLSADIIVWGGWADLYEYYLPRDHRMNLIQVGYEAPPENMDKALSMQRPSECPIKVWGSHTTLKEFNGFLDDLGVPAEDRNIKSFIQTYVMLK